MNVESPVPLIAVALPYIQAGFYLVLGAASAIATWKYLLSSDHARRYESEVICTHHELKDGRILLQAGYEVRNSGEVPISIKQVKIVVCHPKEIDSLLHPDLDRPIKERTMRSDDPGLEGAFIIHAGERSIFQIRAIVPKLEEIMFIICELAWNHRRQPAPRHNLYVVVTETGEVDEARGTGQQP